jgi:type II secretory ATPase GspE/PulE/Tfp pilus assembly ATPase PilB-like protein
MTRLADLKVQPFQIASAVLGVMATRLIRKLCTVCRQRAKLSERELKLLELTPADAEGKEIYTVGKGCENCYNQGYKDRVAVHELLMVDEKIKDVVMRTVDANAIRKAAVEAGMTSLRQSAGFKVLEGLTSIEEALSKTQTEDVLEE